MQDVLGKELDFSLGLSMENFGAIYSQATNAGRRTNGQIEFIQKGEGDNRRCRACHCSGLRMVGIKLGSLLRTVGLKGLVSCESPWRVSVLFWSVGDHGR